MPDPNWNVFASLPGAAWRNWELLCHALIARNFGRYGHLVSVRVQPVVEFHLRLTQECSLGEPDRWWGWQCKWWTPPGKLTAARKRVISDALSNQRKHLPDLTDWVLWTRQPLSALDWEWLENHSSAVQVHTWHSDWLDTLLVGDCEVLRSVYFGDLILRPEHLASAYAESAATLRDRFLPELHVSVNEQRTLSRLLGADGRPSLARAADVVRESSELEALASPEPPQASLATVEGRLSRETSTLAGLATNVLDYLHNGAIRKAIELAQVERDRDLDEQVSDLLRDLQTSGLEREFDAVYRADSAVTRLYAELQGLVDDLTIPLLAVSGEAGRGKTHFAASIAAGNQHQPPGVLVPARAFRGATVDLDQVGSIAGIGPLSIDDLLEALEGAAARAGRRIPMVIDGLNESGAPRAWADALARLKVKVSSLDHVVVVVTLRPSYVPECLPPRTPTLLLRGFPLEWQQACRRYFKAYRIRADIAALPRERFVEPLFLRIFCEATNPDREEWVDLGNVPPSLVPVLERFANNSIERIRERLRVDPQEVRSRLRVLGRELWAARRTTLRFPEVKKLLGDDPLELDRSLALALEEEGILDRDLEPGGEQVRVSFDALAGYLIADALVDAALDGRGKLNSESEDGLFGQAAHPLAEDVRVALGDLLARRQATALRLVAHDRELQTSATLDLMHASADVIGSEDRDALTELLASGVWAGQSRWDSIFRNRTVINHPLNGRWLDHALRRLRVADRDADWTEWVRANSEWLRDEIDAVCDRWATENLDDSRDELDALWLSWILTSTDRALRDHATQALYWLGRRRPDILQRRAIESLDINDPYVPERLLAACYGVAMANQTDEGLWREAIPAFVVALDSELLGEQPRRPNAHWVIREYALGVQELVRKLHPDLLPDVRRGTQQSVPLPTQEFALVPATDERSSEMRDTLGMDFENYTLGRLVPDRSNYDMDHQGHQRLVSEVLGRVWELGWRRDRFGDIDLSIASQSYPRELDPDKVERYGKKYGWIGFWEAAGRRAARDELDQEYGGRLSDVDLDPSLPTPSQPAPVTIKSWVRSRHKTDEAWVRKGRIQIPDELLRPPVLGHERGFWVCLDGFLRCRDRELGRQVFTFIWAAFIDVGRWSDFADSLEGAGVGRFLMPEPAHDYYTFAGEMPWADSFAAEVRNPEFRGAPRKNRELGDGSLVELEGTAHVYSWEGYHSVLNLTSGETVPSFALCSRLDLRGRPQTFDLYDSEGRLATRTFAAPTGFEDGHLLFMREDLVNRYAEETGRELGWVAWGERELTGVDWRNVPTWYRDLRHDDADQHRRVTSLNELRQAKRNAEQ